MSQVPNLKSPQGIAFASTPSSSSSSEKLSCLDLPDIAPACLKSPPTSKIMAFFVSLSDFSVFFLTFKTASYKIELIHTLGGKKNQNRTKEHIVKVTSSSHDFQFSKISLQEQI